MKSLCRWMLLRPADGAWLGLSKGSVFGGHGLRVAMLLLVLGVLNVVDLMFTLFANQIGWLNEMNPLAAAFLLHGRAPSLICFKLLMVLGGSAVLWRVRRSTWAAPACWILVIAYCALTVIWYLWTREVTWSMEAQTAGRF